MLKTRALTAADLYLQGLAPRVLVSVPVPDPIQKRLDALVIVDRAPVDTARIYFGAWVRLETDRGETVEYRIVGPDEFDLDKGLISIDSPLARALLKKTTDDEVILALPRGRTLYTVLEVRYSPFDRVD